MHYIKYLYIFTAAMSISTSLFSQDVFTFYNDSCQTNRCKRLREMGYYINHTDSKENRIDYLYTDSISNLYFSLDFEFLAAKYIFTFSDSDNLLIIQDEQTYRQKSYFLTFLTEDGYKSNKDILDIISSKYYQSEQNDIFNLIYESDADGNLRLKRIIVDYSDNKNCRRCYYMGK